MEVIPGSDSDQLVKGDTPAGGADAAQLARAVQLDAPPQPGPGEPGALPLVTIDRARCTEQLARYLAMVAMVAGKIYPFIPARFNHQANSEISAAFVALAVEYGWDLQILQGRVGLWLNLGAAVAIPLGACYVDYQALVQAQPTPGSPPAGGSPTPQPGPAEPGPAGGSATPPSSSARSLTKGVSVRRTA